MSNVSDTTPPGLRPEVLEARRLLDEGRAKLREQHDRGSPGIQVCARLTDVVDRVVKMLFDAAVREQTIPGEPDLADKVTLVAHGGYGRRELAPYSDVDVMILYAPPVRRRVAALAERLLRDLSDTRLVPGQSTRTVREAITLAQDDAIIFTSLTESRHLYGSEDLFDRFFDKFKAVASRRVKTLLPEIEAARRQERREYGETIYLLEPNVKRSRGGLRDIQLLRWIGFCRYGTTDPRGLRLLTALSRDEEQTIRETTDFLLGLRNELHYHADKAYDVLTRSEQVRLAERYGYQGDTGLLPVEQFMQNYFQKTRDVRYIVSRFLANARTGSRTKKLFGALVSRDVEGDYRIGPNTLTATPRGLEKLRTNLWEVLRLTDLANLSDKRISHATWETVRLAAADMPDEITPEIAERFLSLLSQPKRLYELLTRLHELGVLEKIIPAFARARGLLQFNEYHKYTVDEHSPRAVRSATQFLDDPGPLGRVYRSIKNKNLLHLALLLHDLGKGLPEDHSDIGRVIALETGVRLHLGDHDTELIAFLVHKHLHMSHLALWLDTNDPAVPLQLAVEVGSPESLKMLYVLTACDLDAVGPGVLNDWKIDLLTLLYGRTMEHLSSDAPITTSLIRLEETRELILQYLSAESDRAWFDDQVAALPPAYLNETAPEQIAAELRQMHRTKQGDVSAWGRYVESRGAVVYTVATHKSILPGIFHRLAGTLSGAGLEILSAQINTLAHGMVLDKFYARDPEYPAAPPPERTETISRALVAALTNPTDEPPVFRQLWGQKKAAETAELSTLPIRVQWDNQTSDRATILEIFSPDRRGLLYQIARTLFDLDLTVIAAKIGTYIDQVVDVFYVTDESGKKIEDSVRLKAIRARLLKAIDSLED